MRVIKTKQTLTMAKRDKTNSTFLHKLSQFKNVEELNKTVAAHRKTLTKSEYNVLNFLSRYSVSIVGVSHLKYKTIGDNLSISKRTVARNIQRLKNKGVITIYQSHKPISGGYGANYYVINNARKRAFIENNKLKNNIIKSQILSGERYTEGLENIPKNNFVYIECESCNNVFKTQVKKWEESPNCPSCDKVKYTSGEKKIKDLLDMLQIHYIPEFCVGTSKDSGMSYRADFYLPDLNAFIEFDGVQHFEPVEFFGGEAGYKNTVKNDEIKNKVYRDEYNAYVLRIPYYIENVAVEVCKFVTPLLIEAEVLKDEIHSETDDLKVSS